MRRSTRLFASLPSEKRKVAIVGGGLAGLSTSFHLLEKCSQYGVDITVFDRAAIGTGGASAVAGGLIHPLSPRGKLVHWGLEGLNATNRLITRACEASSFDPNRSSRIRLRDELYRMALDDKNVKQLRQSAELLPEIAEWLDAPEINQRVGGVRLSDDNNSNKVLGGVRLHNGCCVIHVPSYLQGLWDACLEQAADNHGPSSIQWTIVKDDDEIPLQDFDVTVLCGGAGMFSNTGNDGDTVMSLLKDQQPQQQSPVVFPVQLVRGQSLELRLPYAQQAAVLCGKYISPMPDDPCQALVGATQEFGQEALSNDQVMAELKERTANVVPIAYWEDAVVERVTCASRVQSERGQYGRMPVIGRSGNNNTWVFTGLSSRGLLYHALYGDILTDAILQDNEETMLERCPDLLWWRKELTPVR